MIVFSEDPNVGCMRCRNRDRVAIRQKINASNSDAFTSSECTAVLQFLHGFPFLSLLSYIVIVPLSCVFVGMFRWELNYNQPYSHQYFISLQSSGSEVFSI